MLLGDGSVIHGPGIDYVEPVLRVEHGSADSERDLKAIVTYRSSLLGLPLDFEILDLQGIGDHLLSQLLPATSATSVGEEIDCFPTVNDNTDLESDSDWLRKVHRWREQKLDEPAIDELLTPSIRSLLSASHSASEPLLSATTFSIDPGSKSQPLPEPTTMEKDLELDGAQSHGSDPVLACDGGPQYTEFSAHEATTAVGLEPTLAGDTLVITGTSECLGSEEKIQVESTHQSIDYDDIASLISEGDEYDAGIYTRSAGRNHEIENAIVCILATNAAMTPLLETALQLIPDNRLVNNLRRLLKNFQGDLSKSPSPKDVVTQELAALLRPRETRDRIAKKITEKYVSPDEADNLDTDLQGQDRDRFYLERWLEKSMGDKLPEPFHNTEATEASHLNVREHGSSSTPAQFETRKNANVEDRSMWKRQPPGGGIDSANAVENAHEYDEEEKPVEDRDAKSQEASGHRAGLAVSNEIGIDKGDEGKLETTSYPRLDLVVQAFVKGQPFQELILGLKQLLLPRGLLDDIMSIPKECISFESPQKSKLINAIQGWFEDVTALEWDW